MPKFNPGDRVRVVDGKGPALPNGSEYTISSWYISDGDEMVTLTEKGAINFFARRFELVSSIKPTVQNAITMPPRRKE